MSQNHRSDPKSASESPSVMARSQHSAMSRGARTRQTVAITGADSFLGKNLVGLLEEDDTTTKIILIDVESPSTAGPKSRHYKVDLTRPAIDSQLAEIFRAEEVDTVVHLAFLASPTTATAWAHELESVGTMHVLNACREQHIHKFVMLSQTLLYGPHPSNPNFLTEHHPLRGIAGVEFFQAKIEAEKEARKFQSAFPNACVTILRMAPILGPTVHNWATRWLSRKYVPTMLGFDPLVQFVHEMDAVASFMHAIKKDAPGTFNIAGEGVVPISTVIKLAGRSNVPVPSFVLRTVANLLWPTGLLEASGDFVDYLHYVCVADCEKAAVELGFRPAYSTREAVLDFGGALRLREARLLQETVAS